VSDFCSRWAFPAAAAELVLAERAMRAIRPKDYIKVVGTCLGCLAFFALVIAMEWHRAEHASKITIVSMFVFFSLLSMRALVIYRPRRVSVSSLKIVRGPCWSSSFLSVSFVWVEVEKDGKREKIRLVG
jgi:succinate-acetate transporter protein